jgi:hypothetical protein
MNKRQRINSITAEVAAVIKAAKPINVPKHVPLSERDLPFWNSVIAEFARSEWTDHQLELAAMLARTMSDLEEEQRLFRQEGTISYSEKGTPVVNPRKTAIQMHAGTILSFRRSLSLHARATGGEMETIGPRRALAKKAESGALMADDLLA